MMDTRIEELGIRIEEAPSPSTPLPQAGEGSSVLAAQSSILNPQSSKGFTLIELIVVIIIIVVLGGIFLTRVPLYQEQAEKAAMQQVEGALQSALVLRFGTLHARGAATEKELSILATDNPMTWLQKVPPNYKGEYYAPTPHTVAPGSWMFDLKSRELIYVVDHANYFKPGKDGQKWIRFRVRLGYDPALGRRDSGQELVTTLFEPAEPYEWLY